MSIFGHYFANKDVYIIENLSCGLKKENIVPFYGVQIIIL